MPPNTKPSSRQLDILRHLADGCTTDQVARRISYCPRTVKGDLIDLFTRYGLRNRPHAVAVAIRNGWI